MVKLSHKIYNKIISILEKTKKLSHSNTTWAVYKAQSKSPTIWLQELLDLRYRVSLYMRMQKQRGARGLSVIQKICLYELKCLLFSHSIWLFVTPWTAACQSSLSITNSQSLLKLMSIELVMPSNHLILCCPLLLLPSIFPSIRVFSNESVLCIRWLNIGASASTSVLPMNIQGWFPYLSHFLFLPTHI